MLCITFYNLVNGDKEQVIRSLINSDMVSSRPISVEIVFCTILIILYNNFDCRSTPCPNVKHGDEWGEPGNCDSGDMCGYCHTRTEQQFHPEIYKSTKCNDVQQAGYCPRGVFCAFAHVDRK